jgi:hypothetical protein
MSYRSFEDKYGLKKYFSNLDVEFEIVMEGLHQLFHSIEFGEQARELMEAFVTAHDGLLLKPEDFPTDGEAEAKTLYDQYYLGLVDGEFEPIDVLTFRKVHDQCIRFFQEVAMYYASLVEDDRGDYGWTEDSSDD